MTEDDCDPIIEASDDGEILGGGNNERGEVNPFQHVPDRVDIITADGIEQVHDSLNDTNAAVYAASSVEEQAAFLWKMVDYGVIDLTLGERR